MSAEQLRHARHISRHVAIGRGSDAGGPAHYVSAGEMRFFLGEAKAKMIGRMPWRSHRFQSPSLALHRLPLRKNCIGRVIAIKSEIGRASCRERVCQYV